MKIFIIGTGVMGGAIAKVLAKKKHKVFVYDKSFGKAAKLAKGSGIKVQKDFTNLKFADFVVLAVKPHNVADLSKEAKSFLRAKSVLVSIAVGIKISKLQKLFSHNKFVRMMPNLGVGVGQGAAVWRSGGLNSGEKSKAKKLLDDFTENFEVKNENLIDAFTALCGSGPAYFFYFAQGMQKAAQSLGFDKATAAKLIGKTFSAAAVLQQNQGLDSLIKQVASKKGTTERVLEIFNSQGLHKLVQKAAQGAYQRAKEISNE